MTTFLTVEAAVILHDSLTPVPLLDAGGLVGAVGQPSQTFGGDLLYPTLLEQSAVLMRGISQAEAFLDGNKRAAWFSGVPFLRLNGVVVERVTDEEGLRLLRGIGTEDVTLEGLVNWLAEHT